MTQRNRENSTWERFSTRIRECVEGHEQMFLGVTGETETLFRSPCLAHTSPNYRQGSLSGSTGGVIKADLSSQGPQADTRGDVCEQSGVFGSLNVGERGSSSDSVTKRMMSHHLIFQRCYCDHRWWRPRRSSPGAAFVCPGVPQPGN